MKIAKQDQKVLAKRKTYDNQGLLFWNDGAVTNRMGWYVRGGKLGTERMIWTLADEICLYEASELETVIKVCRRVEKRNKWSLSELRQELARALGER